MLIREAKENNFLFENSWRKKQFEVCVKRFLSNAASCVGTRRMKFLFDYLETRLNYEQASFMILCSELKSWKMLIVQSLEVKESLKKIHL